MHVEGCNNGWDSAKICLRMPGQKICAHFNSVGVHVFLKEVKRKGFGFVWGTNFNACT